MTLSSSLLSSKSVLLLLPLKNINCPFFSSLISHLRVALFIGKQIIHSIYVCMARDAQHFYPHLESSLKWINEFARFVYSSLKKNHKKINIDIRATFLLYMFYACIFRYSCRGIKTRFF